MNVYTEVVDVKRSVAVVGVHVCVRAYELCRQHRNTEISNKRDEKEERHETKKNYITYIKQHAERKRKEKERAINKIRRRGSSKWQYLTPYGHAYDFW